MKTLYHDLLMDHYRYPRHHGRLLDGQGTSLVENPACGDSVHIWITLENGTVSGVGFEGVGCVISQASASLLLEHAHGKPLHEVLSYNPAYMFDLIGMSLGPVRSRCALLSLEALHQAVASYASGTTRA